MRGATVQVLKVSMPHYVWYLTVAEKAVRMRMEERRRKKWGEAEEAGEGEEVDRLLGISQVARIFRTTPSGIRTRLSRSPETLPPSVVLHGKRLWKAEDVRLWIDKAFEDAERVGKWGEVWIAKPVETVDWVLKKKTYKGKKKKEGEV